MNSLFALISNMLNSIPLPSLRGRGWGWGFCGLCALSLAASLTASAQRSTINLKQWQFSRDSINYKAVTVPHDWAINGPFDKKWDLQYVAIEQNGEKEKTEKSGRSGALPWIGRGFYKTTVNLKRLPKTAVLEFDGAMADPHVYINGKLAGHWAYGYNAFRVDAAPYLKKGKNEISVSLNNREESSRWYPGGGLYRPVQLVMNADAATINPWGCYFRTLSIADGKAEVSICTNINNVDKTLSIENQLVDATGKVVAQFKYGDFDAQGNVVKKLTVDDAQLWSPESPYLYKLVTRLYRNNKLIDQTHQKVGIRTVSVAQYDGFQLNGVSRKIKGVCLHHDLGPIGAAVNKAALIRQIRTMKDMGCDAIRTAHNMPSTWQMEICDSMGMMVMAESFDMWIYPKCKNGYALNFKQWADRDMENLVLNHRNHPSIIMWSIGNEIPEQWSEEGRDISKHLQDLCHKLDPTRPVTQGMDQAEAALNSGFAQVMDVPGFNYRVHKYDKNIRQLPKGFLLGSETASTVSSRGVYKFPVEPSDSKKYADGQCSSYDVEYCPWSNLPDDDWQMQDDRDYVIGEFVWTGYDYLGEPSPYDEYWPSRSSYFGICDLAGLPKDRYWLYRSHWRKDDATLHVLPHWTFPGREGETTPVYCYTSYPMAELFVNGKSQGRIAKNPGSRLDRYRLRWNNVKYEPGEIRVVAYDYDGSPKAEKTIRTAGAPARIVLKADRSSISSKGEDLAFVTVSVVDKDGNACATATNKMKFHVTGAAKFRAACNGDATSLVPFNSTEMPLFSGELVVVVEGTKHGTATLSVSTEGLPMATLPIMVE
jgi:beta-galactosidase